MKKNGRHGDNSCLPLYKLTQRYALRRGQRFDHIRHSGADIGIHEEGGVLFRAFFRLGQFQAGHSQPGIQRELHLSVGIGVRGGHQMEFLYSHTFLKRLCHGIQAVLYGDRGIGHRRLSAFESCRWQLHAV